MISYKEKGKKLVQVLLGIKPQKIARNISKDNKNTAIPGWPDFETISTVE